MKFFLHPQAHEELEQAIAFYQQQQTGLEKRFIEAMDDAISRVCRNPLLYRKIEDDVRKCRLLHFPYALIIRTMLAQIRNHCHHAHEKTAALFALAKIVSQ